MYWAGIDLVDKNAPVTFDGNYLEQLAEDSLRENDVTGTVSCEDTIKKAVGETFSCSVDSDLANVVEFSVEDVDGSVRYQFG